MSASATMPYFIKPSVSLTSEEKQVAYEQALQECQLILDGEKDRYLMMSTINSILKTNLPYFYWVGFYMYRNDRLEVGPYQGTLGCLHIDLGRGICGRAAKEQRTIIVQDCHALTEGSEHIACDPNSRSEIVVPVYDSNEGLMAVLDVDSTLQGSFDEVDQRYLEEIVQILSLTN